MARNARREHDPLANSSLPASSGRVRLGLGGIAMRIRCRFLLLDLVAAAGLAGAPAANTQGGPEFPYADAARCQGRTYFDVVNRSRVPVLELYIRPSGHTGRWRKDRLRDATLAPVARLRVDP